jgi:hypothetical protein
MTNFFMVKQEWNMSLSVRFQGVYRLSGAQDTVQAASQHIVEKAKRQTTNTGLPIILGDKEPWMGDSAFRNVYTGKDAEQYKALLPMMRAYRQAVDACRNFIVTGAETGNFVSGESEKFTRKFPMYPSAWKKFERQALRKIQFIDTAEMNLHSEMDSENFNLKTGRFKTNPAGHQNYQYKDLDPIGKAEVNLLLGISMKERAPEVTYLDRKATTLDNQMVVDALNQRLQAAGLKDSAARIVLDNLNPGKIFFAITYNGYYAPKQEVMSAISKVSALKPYPKTEYGSLVGEPDYMFDISKIPELKHLDTEEMPVRLFENRTDTY